MQNIEIEEKENVLFVALNRPEMRNAFGPEMIAELTQCFQVASNNSSLRAIVLSGRGKSFCSGADLNWMKSMVDYSFEENQKDSGDLFEMFQSIYNCPVPVIGKLHGHVMGGAVGLAAVCDIAAAEENTRFCFSEVLLGLVPAVISPFCLAKVSKSFAHEFMITGQIFSAKKALEAGLVQHIGEADSVESYVESVLHQLRMCGPEALRETKSLLRKVSALPEVDAFETRRVTTQVIAERRVSEEGQEGLRGFLEKRNPSWRS